MFFAVLSLLATGAQAPDLAGFVRTFETAEVLAFRAEGSFALSVAEKRWNVAAEILRRQDETGLTLFVEATVEPEAAGSTQRLRLFGSDGAWLLLNNTERSAVRAESLFGLGSMGQALSSAAGTELARANVASGSFQARAPEDLSGRPVHTFDSYPEGEGAERTWSFDVATGAPVRLRSVEPTDGAEIHVTAWTLTGLHRPAGVARSPLTAPEGYAQHAPRSPLPAPKLVTLGSSLGPVREHFEAGAGLPRVLGLFAPS